MNTLHSLDPLGWPKATARQQRTQIQNTSPGNHQSHKNAPFPGSSEIPLPKGLEQWETSSAFSHVYFPFHLANRPFMSSVYMKKERAMKIYYRYVQMKRGVAVLWDREKELEPPRKKIRIEEMTFPEKIHREVTPSPMSMKELLTDSESNLDSKAQEGREDTDSPTEPPALEESSRARTPEWLVALDNGFRCMACCRVFSSVETLRKHVEHGVSEGFSCHKTYKRRHVAKKHMRKCSTL
uniref:Protein FAM170A n=1 Tax=Prolemur simus TaxID=1328070 RepID=A0A8C8YEE0_PROSS